jgi:diguanylate cyclase (GGDEF)-like protein/putative nucleotidyltransferase with HDIG domain
MPALITDEELGTDSESGSGLGPSRLGASFETSLMAQILAGLFAAGATLALLTAALPHPASASVLGLLLTVGGAYLTATLLFWRADGVPAWTLPLVLGWGSTLIAAVAYFSAGTPSPVVFFFLWSSLYASYFFTTTGTAIQVIYIGVAYGALLAARPPESGAGAWWLVGMGTLLVAVILIRSMRERVELLIERLYDAARTDPLTRLQNRRGFRELLDLELERARRSRGPVSLMVGDVDHFKEVNDRAGHQVADNALQRIARALEREKRQIDGLARVGGEEFALILPDTDRHSAFVIAERLRDAVRGEFAGDTVSITMSFGVAGHPDDAETAGSLLRAADAALFAAKENGRDRSVLHSTSLRGAGREARDVAGERFLAVVLELAEAVDLRFSGSARHSETVGRYAAMMAEELGLSDERVERVRLAGMLHDVGKVGVPDVILQKPAKLTDEEFEIVKRHPELGAQILEHPNLSDVRAWVGAHHERPDGRGYPLGVSGDAISLEARVLAVADAFEAMTSDRAYRAAIGLDSARAELKRCAGSQFDPRVVDALLAVLDRDADRATRALAHTA